MLYFTAMVVAVVYSNQTQGLYVCVCAFLMKKQRINLNLHFLKLLFAVFSWERLLCSRESSEHSLIFLVYHFIFFNKKY